MDYSVLVWQFFKSCVAALCIWVICVIIFDVLGAQLAPVCDADPSAGDQFDATSILQAIHTGGTILPAIFIIGGFIRAYVLAIKPDSQVDYYRRR